MKPSPPLGRSAPLGATMRDGGTNFSVFSRTATRIELLLFDHLDGIEVLLLLRDERRSLPVRVIELLLARVQVHQSHRSPSISRV